jgi:CheY-like chemotaxis protein
MRESSGTRFYRELKADPELRGIPVVIITAITGFDGDPRAYEKFLQRAKTVPPPEGFFPKPIEQQPFLQAIAKLLG